MKFIFLSYVSRSGSTMLARQLAARSSDLLVLPEFNFPLLLLARGEANVRRMTAAQVYALMHADRQIGNLQLEDDALMDAASIGGEAGIQGILERLALRYADVQGKTDPAMVMLKKGGYLKHAVGLSKLMPGCQFVHIYRDVRGVANSMISTQRAYFPEERMGRGDALFVAGKWSDTMKMASALAADPDVDLLEVRYEDLCQTPDDVIADLLVALSAGSSSQPQSQPYHFDVGVAEAQLHTRIHQAPDQIRIDAWQDELAVADGIAVEWAAKNQMKARGYPTWFLPKTDKTTLFWLLIRAYALSGMKAITYYYRRLRRQMEGRR